jgi:hypothetical protein
MSPPNEPMPRLRLRDGCRSWSWHSVAPWLSKHLPSKYDDVTVCCGGGSSANCGRRKAPGAVVGAKEKGGVRGVAEPPDITPEIRRPQKRRRRGMCWRKVSVGSCVARVRKGGRGIMPRVGKKFWAHAKYFTAHVSLKRLKNHWNASTTR